MSPITRSNFNFNLSSSKMKIREPVNKERPRYFSKRLKYRKSFNPSKDKELPSVEKVQVNFLNFPKTPKQPDLGFDISKYKKPERSPNKN